MLSGKMIALGPIKRITYSDGTVATSNHTIWVKVAGSYASTSTFTFTGTQTNCDEMIGSLIVWQNTSGVGRFGHITNATVNAGTVTATVYGTANMAASDKNYSYAPNIKSRQYERLITIPGEQIADASNPQGMWYQGNAVDSLQVFDVSAWVLTAAAGAGAACAFNIYHGTTNIFSSAVDLTTNTSSLNNQPNTVIIPPGVNMTLRVTASAGATNKASNLQVRYYAVPSRLFYGK